MGGGGGGTRPSPFHTTPFTWEGGGRGGAALQLCRFRIQKIAEDILRYT